MGFRTWLSNSISKKALLVAFIHWYVTFFLEKNFFVTSTLEKPFIAIAKLLIIVCFWQIAFYMARRYKLDTEYRRYIHFAGFYFIFIIIIMLLIWPGIWFWDDLWVLAKTRGFEIEGWQHFLTGAFYYCGIFIFPSPIAITILHIFLISLIIGYFINAISIFSNYSKFALLAYIPFLLPAVLLQNLQIFRASLFGFLVLYFFTTLAFKSWHNKSISYLFVFLISSIAALITTLRGEGIYFLFVAPFLFLLYYWKLTNKLKKILFFSMFFIFIFIINFIQIKIMGDDNQRYKLTTIVSPLHDLVLIAKSHNRPDLLIPINESINTELFEEYSANDAFWFHPLIKNNYFNKKSRRLLYKGYVQLILAFPKEFFLSRINRYNQTRHQKPFSIFLDPTNKEFLRHYNYIFSHGISSNFIDYNRREKTLKKLRLDKNKKISSLIYDITKPLYLCLVLFIALLFKKKLLAAISILCIFPLFILVFFSAPTNYFMYYFSFYLTGYAFTFGALSIALSKLFQKNSTLKK